MPLDANFDTEQEAARALLADVVGVLRDAGVAFVVVGGWVTKLFHSATFGHPGTFDTDVLLETRSLNDGTFEAATARLLKAGYVRAVKNPFQVHRLIKVQGEFLIFHADFLSPDAPGDDLDLMVGGGPVQSIYTPTMALVLKHEDFRTRAEREFEGVRFPSAATFVATKAAGALLKKRRRDPFDIFVTLHDAGPDVVGAKWRDDIEFAGPTAEIAKAVCGNAVAKVLQFLPKGHSEENVRDVFDEFLRAAARVEEPDEAEAVGR